MTALKTAHGVALFVLTAGVLSLPASLATARPADQPAAEVPAVPVCALQRLGTEFVRCDNLTGAGVPASPWAPEQPPTCALQWIGPELVRCDNLTGAKAPTLPTPAVPTSVRQPETCSLQRIGWEFVRCDNLTGAGLPAFPSIDPQR